jgi:hypothetical protein
MSTSCSNETVFAVPVGNTMVYCLVPDFIAPYQSLIFRFSPLQEYLVWHKQQRDTLTSSNWESRRFLIMQCLDKLGHCGGTADRLKSFVFLLRIAHESQRIFLIYWNMPARLTRFLVPPKGGIDWRVPMFMVEKVCGAVSMRFCHRCWGMLLFLSIPFACGPPLTAANMLCCNC